MTKEKTKILDSNEKATKEEQVRQVAEEPDPIAALSLLDGVVSRVQLNRQDTLKIIQAVNIIRKALEK